MAGPVTVWEAIYAQKGKVFTEVHADLPALARWFKAGRAQTVLDLGCGSGRHTVYLAEQGFRVFGLDSASLALHMNLAWLRERGLTAGLALQAFEDGLPYPDRSFDALISVQVIHHGLLSDVRRTAQEIERVLRPGGRLFVSVASKHPRRGEWTEIEPGTFVRREGWEAGLPHRFYDPPELAALFPGCRKVGLWMDLTNHTCYAGQKEG